MVGLYCGLWAVLTAFAPLWVALAGLRDISGHRRFASVRLLFCVWVYFSCELLGLLAACGIWVWHRLMPVAGWKWFLARNHRLQAWWTRVLLTAVTRAFSMRIQIDGHDCLRSGPFLLLMRHASVLDTLLPGALVSWQLGYRLRYVLKRELLVDPCLDVVGNRLPNYFVDRGGETARETVAVGRLAVGLEADEGVLIYPEGTRFTANKRRRALEKIRASDPSRYRRLEQLTHVLPPRLGGVSALLDQGEIDVVFCSHSGLEGLMRPQDLLTGKVVGTTIEVHFWRVQARDIPEDAAARTVWLDEQWAQVDRKAARGAANNV